MLRPYQERIASYLYEHDQALCIARPGAGKTIAALTAIAELLRDGVVRHALILAPKRVARVVWPDEIAEWAHTRGLRYAVLDGSPRKRFDALALVPERDLTIVGLDVIPWLLDSLAICPVDHPVFDLLVIDEISRLRSPTGTRSKALAKYAARWRMIWGLTGTLRPNSALDLFMPSRIVSRGTLWGKSFYTWRGRHFRATDWMGYDWHPLPGAEERLNADLAPLTVMVPEGELPTVTPTVVIDHVDLPPAARREYDRMQRTLMAKVGDDDVLAGSAAIATGKLAQMANGFVYDDVLADSGKLAQRANGFVYDEESRSARVHEVKREWLRDLVETATGPTLVIYEYLADLSMIRQELADPPCLGAGVSDSQAAQNIADWNAGKLPFMALHPASGGHGLNLQHGGADMAWVSPTWSPELWEQTIARLARPGQTRPVVVRVCVARGTVDEMKLDRVHGKMSAQQAFERWVQRWHAGAAAA